MVGIAAYMGVMGLMLRRWRLRWLMEHVPEIAHAAIVSKAKIINKSNIIPIFSYFLLQIYTLCANTARNMIDFFRKMRNYVTIEIIYLIYIDKLIVKSGGFYCELKVEGGK